MQTESMVDNNRVLGIIGMNGLIMSLGLIVVGLYCWVRSHWVICFNDSIVVVYHMVLIGILNVL